MDSGTATAVAALVAATASGIGHYLTYAQAKLARSEAAGVHGMVQGNGKGDLVTMSEQTLLILGRLEGKLDGHITDERAHRG